MMGERQSGQDALLPNAGHRHRDYLKSDFFNTIRRKRTCSRGNSADWIAPMDAPSRAHAIYFSAISG
jgi:hypothetical protein